ncbi:hypothetical protein G7046_g67 [Stylonectria norvegica]|nr:hypothetical protein G7046_g67 [Stylonectria norvegica]
MKWSSIFFASSIIAQAFAGPINRERAPFYCLRISTPAKELDGKYLAMASGVVGVYESGSQASALPIITLNDRADEVYLFPWLGGQGHALGLDGSDGYLEFKDLTITSIKDENREIRFSLGEDNVGGKELLYGKGTPGWIASPTADKGWAIKHYDSKGGAFVTQDYIPIKIVLESRGRVEVDGLSRT